MLHHELALVSHQAIDLLSHTLQLLLHSDLFLQQHLFIQQELFALPPILRYFALGNLAPFLEELYIVLLGLLLDHLVVGVHFAHQFDMPLVHVLHIVLDLRDVRLGELYWHHVLNRVLGFKPVFIFVAVTLLTIILFIGLMLTIVVDVIFIVIHVLKSGLGLLLLPLAPLVLVRLFALINRFVIFKVLFIASEIL